MTCLEDNNQFDLAMELLITNDLGNITEVIWILMNSAKQIERSHHLQTTPYERTEERIRIIFTASDDQEDVRFLKY
jgi:hypothetical protein